MSELSKSSNAIRFLAADMIQQANSGHPGIALGMADVATVLFQKFLKFDASQPNWINRDRFILSAGHGSALLYSLLWLTGYESVSIDDIKNFRQLHSKAAGHPEYERGSGIEMTTGPLGQGLATSVGMAISESKLRSEYGSDLIDHHIWVMVGDGCLMEGISQEAISLAGHLNLNHLIVLWDNNGITIDGSTEISTKEDQLKRFKASGWDVIECDGHDYIAIEKALAKAKESKHPCLVAFKTNIAQGAPTKVGTHHAHGAPLGDEEIASMRNNLNWPFDPFEIPEDILNIWRNAGKMHHKTFQTWQKTLEQNKYRDEFKHLFIKQVLPNDWKEKFNRHVSQKVLWTKDQATRQSSGELLSYLTNHIPQLVGGSADLTPSVNTKTNDLDDYTDQNRNGRYIRYGIREHGMAAAMNGIALHAGFIPYGGTFLVFSDYMRGAMRLSAIMGTQTVYILTHDSIGVGEDGPTHQPVEILASLRALPNLNVFRPSGFLETAACWMWALEHKNTPVALVLSRQTLPQIPFAYNPEEQIYKGAYILKKEEKEHQLTLIATGSEVHIALAAKEQLEQKYNIGVRLVSMPCMELFLQLPLNEQNNILGNTKRIAIEAGVRFGWSEVIGRKGDFVGMDGFGASAPGDQLYHHFNITIQEIIRKSVSDD